MALYKNLPYDTLRDFAAVSIFSESLNVLVVNASSSTTRAPPPSDDDRGTPAAARANMEQRHAG